MLEQYSYIPLLQTRNAELKAYEFLPDEVKNLVFPIFTLSPLPNAKSISKTFERIKNVTGGRRFAVDLDRSVSVDKSKPSHLELQNLLSEVNGFENYYKEIKKFDNATPVFQLTPLPDDTNLNEQLFHCAEIGLRPILKITYDLNRISAIEYIEKLNAINSEFVLVLDMGWSPQFDRLVWVNGILAHLRTLKNFDCEIVISGSSFPDSFGEYRNREKIEVKERAAFNEIMKNNNEFKLYYSDWGSARPKLKGGGGLNEWKRIDYPREQNWQIFREISQDFKGVAKLAMAEPDWKKNLDIWGTRKIEWTAKGDTANSIKSFGEAAAVRINIHIVRQAMYGRPLETIGADEVYVD